MDSGADSFPGWCRVFVIAKKAASNEAALDSTFAGLAAIDTVEVLECSFESFDHRFFAGAKPFTGVVVLLVGLVLAFGIADLSL